MDDRLITVAIHTLDRAQELKLLLEREGIEVVLQNVNLTTPVVSSGVRVRINESDLPFALRIIENQDVFAPVCTSKSKSKPKILIPVDFSAHSEKACHVAFKLANRLKSTVHILHSYTDPSSGNLTQLSDVMSFDTQPNDNKDTRRAILAETTRQMDILKALIISKMKSGEFPAVKYTTEITEGIPEDAINQYTKECNPLLIVMGTRSSNTKERELLGSVTAEVLDTCKYPVLTVPFSANTENVGFPEHIIFFSNFDQNDILALDTLFRLLPIEKSKITLVRIPSKKSTDNQVAEKALNRLKEYCEIHYSQHTFDIDTISIKALETDFNRLTKDTKSNLIAIPNKRKNIFARLFNPGVAHKILFHTDFPMMVIPV